MRSSLLRHCALCAMVACFAGCASPAGPLSLSLTELGSEVQADGGSWTSNLSHRRAHNITGLGAADTVGTVSSDPDPPLIRIANPFSRSTLPDQLALRLDTGCSKVIVRDFSSGTSDPVTVNDVLQVRNALRDAETTTYRVLQLRAQKALATELGRLAAAAPEGTEGTPAAAAGEALRRSLTKGWLDLGGSTAPVTADDWQQQVQQLDGLLATAAAAQGAADAALMTLRSKPGILVARWQYSASKDLSVAATGVAAEHSQSQQRQGFVVLGQPRTLTLMAGDDLAVRACRASPFCRWRNESLALNKRTGIDAMFSAGDLYTTTYQLMAKHVAWVESGVFAQHEALGVQLDKVLAAVGSTGAAAALPPGSNVLQALDALKLQVSHARQSQAAVTNMGATSAGQETELPFAFDGDDEYTASVAAVRAFNNGFLQVASMRSTLDHHATDRWAKLVRPLACRGNAPVAAQFERTLQGQLGCTLLTDATQVALWGQAETLRRQQACARLPMLRAQISQLVNDPVTALLQRVLDARFQCEQPGADKLPACQEVRRIAASTSDLLNSSGMMQTDEAIRARFGCALLLDDAQTKAWGEAETSFRKSVCGRMVQAAASPLVPEVKPVQTSSSQ
jgi:hypothetical protein